MTTRTPLVRLATSCAIAIVALLSSAGSAGAVTTASKCQPAVPLVTPGGQCAQLAVTKWISADGNPAGQWFDADTSGQALRIRRTSPTTFFYYRIQVANTAAFGGLPIYPTSLMDPTPDSGCDILPLTNNPGDTNMNGAVDPGEVWVWYCKTAWSPTGANPYKNRVTFNGYVWIRTGLLSNEKHYFGDTSDDAWGQAVRPQMSLQKSGPAGAHEGDTVTYNYRVHNDTGNPASQQADLSNVMVKDDKCTGAGATWTGPKTGPNPGDPAPPSPSVLGPGQTWYYHCTYTLGTALPDVVTNTGTVTAQPNDSGGPIEASDKWNTVIHHPSFTIKKEGPKFVKAGDTIHWKITLTNTGNSSLDVKLTDTTCQPTPWTTTLGDGDADDGTNPKSVVIWCFSKAPNDASTSVQNNACASAEDELKGAVAEKCAMATTVIVHPGLSMTKTVDKTGAKPGDVLHYTVTMTNTGDTTLTVTPSDPGCDPGTKSPTQPDFTIAPGNSMSFTCSHVFTAGEAGGNGFSNQACADAVIADNDRLFYPAPNSPIINSLYAPPEPDVKNVCSNTVTTQFMDLWMSKTGTNEAHEGNPVSFTIQVKNTGKATLTVSVSDDKCPGVTPASKVLAPGQPFDFTCTYTLGTGLADSITNTATATGTPSAGPPTTATDSHTTTIEHGRLSIKKTGPKVVKVGDTFKWHITLTNTGNSTLKGNLTDSGCPAVNGTFTLGDGDGADAQDPTGAPKSITIDCTATAPNDGTDLTKNTACVTAKDELGYDVLTPKEQLCSDFTTKIVHPRLKVTKTVDEFGAVAGDTLHYHVTITNDATNNISPVTLFVTRSDPGCDPGTFVPAQESVTLAPGASFQFTCTHKVTAQETGPITNTACADGDIPSTDPGWVNPNDIIPPPSTGPRAHDAHACGSATSALSQLRVTKSGPPQAHEGDTVTYHYSVQNIGSTDLKNITLTDDKCPSTGQTGPFMASTGTVAPPQGTSGPTLHPGETWYYHCTYKLGTGLPDNLVNTATATGHPASGPDPSASTTYSTKILHGAFTIKKEGPLYVVAGKGFDWLITVKNTGNARLTFTPMDAYCTIESGYATSFTVSEGQLVQFKCRAKAPNDGTVLMHNEVCARAHDDLYNPSSVDQKGFIKEQCAEAWTTIVHPNLIVTKTVDEKGAQSGDLLHYHITVTNSGDSILLVTPKDFGKYDTSPVWPGCTNFTKPGTLNPQTGGEQPENNTQWTLGPGTSFSVNCTKEYHPPDAHPDADYTNTVCAYGLVRVAFTPSEPIIPLSGIGTASIGEPPHDIKVCAEAKTLHAEIHLLKNHYESNYPVGDSSDTNNGPVHPVHEGDTVIYDYSVENKGHAPLYDVKLADIPCSQPTATSPNDMTKFTGPTENDFSPDLVVLQPKKDWEYTCTQALPAKGDPRRVAIDSVTADGDTSSLHDTFTNDAFVSAHPQGNSHVLKEDAEHTVTFIHPGLKVTKVGPKANKSGEKVPYSITVTNTGDTKLYDIQLTDVGCVFDGGPPAKFDLNTGETSLTYYCKADPGVDPGSKTQTSYTNTACATGVDVIAKNSLKPDDITKGTAQGCMSVTTNMVHPELQVIKTVDKTSAEPGTVLHYTVTVINKGDVEMSVTAYDTGCEHAGPLLHRELNAYGSTNIDGSPADRFTFTCDHVFNPPDGAVSYTNTACAKGWISDGLTDLPKGAALIALEQHPCRIDASCGADSDHYAAKACGSATTWLHGKISVAKSGPKYSHEKDPATFTFTVQNTGKTDLHNVTVSDNKCRPGDPSSPDAVLTGPFKQDGVTPVPDPTHAILHAADPPTTPAGEIWIFKCTYTLGDHLTPPDDKGSLHNTVTASGFDPGDGEATATDNWSITMIHPDLVINKKGPDHAVAGEEIHYTIYVKNTGDTALNVQVTDAKCGYLSDSGKKDNLAPGQSTTFNCTVPAVSDPGLLTDTSMTNEACVTGKDRLAQAGTSIPKGTVTKCSSVTTKLVHPSLSVVKTVDAQTADPGDVLHYTVTVTNTGDWEQRVHAYDAGCEQLSSDPVTVTGASSVDVWKELDKGASFTFTCTHVFDPAKPDTSYTNKACADGWVPEDHLDSVKELGDQHEIDSHACSEVTTTLLTHSISGMVFEDMTANGQHDAGEPPIPNVVVYADQNNNGKHDPNEPFGTTDANGNYSVSVPLGTTVLRMQVPDGYTCSVPAGCSYTAKLVNGAPVTVSRPAVEGLAARVVDPTGVDFGAWRPASVSGTIYNDTNRNGIHDSGEPPIFNATAYADLNGNGSLDPGEPSSVTPVNGKYTITGLAPGSYTIRQVPIAGNDCTSPANCAHSVTVQSGSTVTGKDFLDGASQAVLGERITPGSAKLVGRTGCVSKKFTATVTGKSIASVSWLLDGYLIAGGKATAAVQVFSIGINPQKVAIGRHRLVAKITFKTGSGTSDKRLTLTFQRCAAQLKAPAFTGGLPRKQH